MNMYEIDLDDRELSLCLAGLRLLGDTPHYRIPMVVRCILMDGYRESADPARHVYHEDAQTLFNEMNGEDTVDEPPLTPEETLKVILTKRLTIAEDTLEFIQENTPIQTDYSMGKVNELRDTIVTVERLFPSTRPLDELGEEE